MNELAIDTGESGKFFGRGTDYLGILGAKLRDLQGPATLAHELIQNADDTPGGGCMSFDIRQDALVVDNDGTFSDCGHIEEDDCPWKSDESKGYRCDFHRFRRVASGDKRDQLETTGAFGIGFIAVYQITDQPELISAGRHWIISEEKSEAERICQCGGCDRCRNAHLPGTRFILPWVRDPNTLLRRALRAEAIAESDIALLLWELERALPRAMLFLKRLNRIDIKRDGVSYRSFERILENNTLLINDGESDSIWHLIRGNFKAKAGELRERYGGRIEEKRSPDVIIAIPAVGFGAGKSGLLCASLPTQHETGLPFHVNADFFTSSDRKKVIMESDFQSEWNLAALEGAAEAFRVALDQLPRILGHKQLWQSLVTLFQVASKTQIDNVFRVFWEAIAPVLRTSNIAFTSKGEWRKPPEVVLLETDEEEEGLEVLEALGLDIAHQEIRPYIFRVPRTEILGIELLNVPHIVSKLRDCGLTTRTELADTPEALRSPQGLGLLSRELGRLLKRRRTADEQRGIEDELAQCAIVIGRDEALWPCTEVFRADEKTVALFSEVIPALSFLKDQGADARAVQYLCPELTAANAVTLLQGWTKYPANQPNPQGRLDPRMLIPWFESRRHEILDYPERKRQLAELPIFPSSTGLRPLTVLALPGDFTDPLGIAEIVDVRGLSFDETKLGTLREFLSDLGGEELTFKAYAKQHVPRAFLSGAVAVERKRELLGLLADRLGEIRDDPVTRNALASVDIIECENGIHRRPDQSYFNEPTIKMILGNNVSFAVVPAERRQAVGELYRWLDVADKPRYTDIVARIYTLVAYAPTPEAIQSIESIFLHLGERFKKGPGDTGALSALKWLRWLPVRHRRDRWYSAQESYAVFQDYLFDSQALFIDMPRRLQNDSVDLLTFLDVKDTPYVSQVVNHLLYCAQNHEVVNNEVYTFLNRNIDVDIPTIERLIGRPCLLTTDGHYIRPDHVFFSEHQFGRFRYWAQSDLARFRNLLQRLGARDHPNHQDALKVIIEISEEYSPSNRPLADEPHRVVMASWTMLGRALQNGEINDADLHCLRPHKVVPTPNKVLTFTDRVYFEDRADLAARFAGFLDNNVITRPKDAWRAMMAAGVKSLASIVTSQIVEYACESEDQVVLPRIQERRGQLARVLEAEAGESDVDSSILDSLQCRRATHLQIQYILNAFDRTVASSPEAAPAHFHRGEVTLYYAVRDAYLPWPSIAREIALALCPDSEPGRLASGIKDVLSADSEGEAKSILDELGFPPMQEPITNDHVSPGLLGALGGDSPPQGYEAPDRAGPTAPCAQAGAGRPSTGEAIEGILGEGVPKPMPGLDSEEDGEGTDNQEGYGRRNRVGQGPHRPSSRQGEQSRLLTYVVPAGRGGREGPASGDYDRNSAVARSGVQRVLDYEGSHGRFPSEMPLLNPGYDVESRDASGEIVRYIEVKSTADRWGNRGVGVTRTEFDTSNELGDRFWLYIVERAEHEDFRIFRIQDPGREVNLFMYDTGWQALAEVDSFLKQDVNT